MNILFINYGHSDQDQDQEFFSRNTERFLEMKENKLHLKIEKLLSFEIERTLPFFEMLKSKPI